MVISINRLTAEAGCEPFSFETFVLGEINFNVEFPARGKMCCKPVTESSTIEALSTLHY